jgi:hypothetical protein
MKVCDRHPAAKAVDTMRLETDDTHVDLCAGCIALVREFIANHHAALPVERKKPRKNQAQA